MTNEMIDHAIQAWILIAMTVGIPAIICAIIEPFLKGGDDD